ncbi:MAG: YggS family pyridoxal phosphate-dependent enzyme [Proteiniphilum sp.]|uniref:YggS family pyridoxal phosphate-dependent enzyme n=1 Tax=Proteiniphilum sp. TaxID=1926877 RepID=UPI0009290418|nr:YggS family pyridoxal phosphate-dependent enzyme [Proteiniphilum sp.]MEA5129198.1 YggS family pyridoxal phosphate-dependent enzyme [Proteiniphilum sp.]OJV86015.1 MAG: YggS family pyridoxal phosphate enzyme [Bacteroidia bacterium 44-10]
MSIQSHIDDLRETVPSAVTLVAVSKFHPAGMVREAYDAGQRIFGESRVQELVVKKEQLPGDIAWHFIGNLQRNKVKQIAPFISLIHSLDNERLMLEIEKQGAANGRVIPCLLQIHIAEEETKAGFSPGECRQFLEGGKWKTCPHVRIAGVMGMATFTDDENQVRKEFRQLKSLFEEFKAGYFADDPVFREISMGMTGDYPVAIEEGSTMIRIGTLIFGDR